MRAPIYYRNTPSVVHLLTTLQWPAGSTAMPTSCLRLGWARRDLPLTDTAAAQAQRHTS